jgi:hypothetical protein
MSSSAFVLCWSDPIQCLKSVIDGDNASFVEVGTSLDQMKAGLADANIQAQGLNPDGTFIAPQYAATFGTLTGIDPSDTSAVKSYVDQIGVDSNNFFDQQYAQALAGNPLFPSVSFPGISWPGGSSTVIAIIVLLVILFIIFKVVK